MIGLAHFPDSKTKRRPSEIASVQILRTRHSRLAIFYDYRRKENVAFLEREISERSARPLPNEESSIVYLASNGIVPNDRKSRSRTIYIYIILHDNKFIVSFVERFGSSTNATWKVTNRSISTKNIPSFLIRWT